MAFAGSPIEARVRAGNCREGLFFVGAQPPAGAARGRGTMKCQQCDKPAVFHITDLTDEGKPHELHLCEDHAREYLTSSGGEPASTGSMAAVLAQQMAQQMAVGQTAAELAELDQQSCPVCGITFYEFRSQGRLGCPHDYVSFQAQLEPLILNIHGETQHTGKIPKRCPEGGAQRTHLIRLRREMKEAVQEEDYERASELRDKIRRIEAEGNA
jgi:protein arginine kinase activator